jgi:hypothetical protein
LFEVGPGNEKVAGGSLNAEFRAQFAKTGFGQPQEMAKFPTAEAVVLARDIRTSRDEKTDHDIKGEFGRGSAAAEFARPKAKFAPSANATRNIPDPQEIS